MKTFLAGLLILPLLAGCSSKGGSSSEPPFDAATTAQLDAGVAKVMAEHGISGVVVGAWFPGRGEYVVAKGKANLATGEPMTTNHHFRIGSNTKAFVGTVILQLVDEGQIKLDDPVTRYFPWLRRNNEITIRMLLNMTSGVPSYTEVQQFGMDFFGNPHRTWTRQGLLDYVKDLPLGFDPGTRYHYSNTNTVLLGMIIEAHTGKSVAQSLVERIYTPMGMSHTSWGEVQLPVPFTHGYTRDTPDDREADTFDWNPGWADAAGQLVSTMNDLKPWAKTLATPRLITAAMHAQRIMWVNVAGAPTEGRYGLAVGQSGAWIHHQGQLPGYNTIAAYLPEMDATIVVLANTDAAYGGRSPAIALLTTVSDILSPQYSPGK